MDDVEPTFDTCQGRNCGQVIRWALTEGGKPIPMNIDMSPDGNLAPVTLPDGSKRVRVLTGSHLPAIRPCFVPHHRTCVDSNDFRRRREAIQPRCRAACGVPMDPWLLAHGWRYHICCAPLPIRAHVEAVRGRAGAEQLQQTPLDDGW